MICYRDRAYCSDHDQCATMDCDRRLTTKDDEHLTANHWMPVEWVPLADLCGKYEVKKCAAQSAGGK